MTGQRLLIWLTSSARCLRGLAVLLMKSSFRRSLIPNETIGDASRHPTCRVVFWQIAQALNLKSGVLYRTPQMSA